MNRNRFLTQACFIGLLNRPETNFWANSPSRINSTQIIDLSTLESSLENLDFEPRVVNPKRLEIGIKNPPEPRMYRGGSNART